MLSKNAIPRDFGESESEARQWKAEWELLCFVDGISESLRSICIENAKIRKRFEWKTMFRNEKMQKREKAKDAMKSRETKREV